MTTIDDAHPNSLGEAHKSLLLPPRIVVSADSSDEQKREYARAFAEAQGAVRDGRLFVIEGLPPAAIDSRTKDAWAAFKAGRLGSPFPVTHILVSVAGEKGASLVCARVEDNVPFGLAFFAFRAESENVQWVAPRVEDQTKLAAYLPAYFSIIADGRPKRIRGAAP